MNNSLSHDKGLRLKSLIPRGLGSDPYVDWPVMLGVAAAAVCALVYAGYAAYLSVGDQLAAGASVVSARANAADIAGFSKLASQRAEIDADRAAALKGYVGPADPSR